MINYERHSEHAYVLKSFLTIDENSDILDEMWGGYNSYMLKREKSGESEHPKWLAIYKPGPRGNQPTVGDNMKLIDISVKVKYAVKKLLKPDFAVDLRRINTNMQFKYQDSTFHNDGFRHLDEEPAWTWTFLAFVQDNWDTQWGGEFCYQTVDGKYNYIPFIPGDCVLFNGWLEHKGNAPNTLSRGIRSTVAWTFVSPDPTVDIHRVFP